jgi:myosin heavy subunit
MSRRSSESPISLFSFQDIIMSVVGIVILITMILILKLIVQMTLATPSSAVNIDELQRQIETIRSVLQQIQDEITVLHQAKNESKIWTPSQEQIDAMKSTTERLEAEISAVDTQIKNGEHRNEKLKHDPKIQQLAETESRIKKLLEELKNLQEENKTLTENESKLQSQAKSLRTKNSELDKEVAQDVAVQLKVTVPKTQEKTAFILIYGNNGIDVLPTDGSPAKNYKTASSLDSWIDTRDKNKEYFVVYVRPSRFGRYEKIIQDLKVKGFDVGLQVIGEKTSFMIDN